MLTTVDILLEGLGPGNVVNLGNVVAVQLQCSEELVEAETGVSSDVGNTSGGRVEGAGNDNTGDMVHRDHVHSVVNVGATVDLNAAEAESDEEIIVVGNLSGGLVCRMNIK